MNPESLRQENHRFGCTRGVSRHNRHEGFRPAFRDSATGRIYLSRFANGQPAPMHLLDGLPEAVVLERAHDGQVLAVKATVVAGFVRAERFYTRDQAARWVSQTLSRYSPGGTSP